MGFRAVSKGGAAGPVADQKVGQLRTLVPQRGKANTPGLQRVWTSACAAEQTVGNVYTGEPPGQWGLGDNQEEVRGVAWDRNTDAGPHVLHTRPLTLTAWRPTM